MQDRHARIAVAVAGKLTDRRPLRGQPQAAADHDHVSPSERLHRPGAAVRAPQQYFVAHVEPSQGVGDVAHRPHSVGQHGGRASVGRGRNTRRHLLEDELKWPGWEASDVLKVLTRHSSTFWGVFERKLLDDSKTLLRFLHPARFDAHAHECVIITKKLLHASYAAFSKPVSESQTAPDPSTIRGFISLGDA